MSGNQETGVVKDFQQRRRGRPSRPRIRVLVADGLALVAESIGAALRQFPDLEVLDSYPSTGPRAIEEAVAALPDVVLVDYWIPEMHGVALATLMATRAPNSKLLFLSWLHGVKDIQRTLDAGAVGFLPKTIRVAELVQAVRRAYAGERPVFQQELAALMSKLRDVETREKLLLNRISSLTPREADVLRLTSLGRSGAQIGKELGISPATARVHLHNILEKTQARTKEEAIAMARACGFIRT